jgi:hypothetical protein
MPVSCLAIAPKDSFHILPRISKLCMGRIVQQILDKMSSGAGILLFLQIILFDTANSFTGIGLRPVVEQPLSAGARQPGLARA